MSLPVIVALAVPWCMVGALRDWSTGRRKSLAHHNDHAGPRQPEGELMPVLRRSRTSVPPAAVDAAPADPLRASLQRARRVAPELASATDAVNVALEQVEQALAALHLGVTAAVDLYDGRDPVDGWMRFLRYGKDGSAWRLLLESGPDGGDAEDWSQSPLLNASKEVRLQAVERLPALVDALVDVAEDQVGRFRAAAAKAHALAATIAEAE